MITVMVSHAINTGMRPFSVRRKRWACWINGVVAELSVCAESTAEPRGQKPTEFSHKI